VEAELILADVTGFGFLFLAIGAAAWAFVLPGGLVFAIATMILIALARS
jgi:hypothetical protein